MVGWPDVPLRSSATPARAVGGHDGKDDRTALKRYRDAPGPVRVAIATRLRARRLSRAGERLVVPATTRGEGRRSDDFRRVIVLIAVVAVGFFVPSLPMAGVPIALWLPFTLAAGLAGLVVAGSFFMIDSGARIAAVLAFADACVIAFIGWLFAPYYHQIGLLFALLVGGFAVVHGLRASLGAVLPGAFLVPYAIHAPAGVNATDPVYAFIYLMGASLIPWTAGRLAGRRARALQRQVRTIRAAEKDAVLILARAAEAKDEDTGEHVARVGQLTAALGERIGMSAAEVEDIRYAAMLHDVGKLHVPDHILLKPGPLLPDEWDLMRQHTVWGAKIMGSSSAFETARAIARSHHEDWDGAGYPDGLRREAIPLSARIVRLADVFDALRSDRPYKPAWEFERCIAEIKDNAGRQFDPDLVPIFISIVEGEPAASPIVAVRTVNVDPAFTPPARPPRPWLRRPQSTA
jgi:putative nucleotidyltransferase with HDIG domain